MDELASFRVYMWRNDQDRWVRAF